MIKKDSYLPTFAVKAQLVFLLYVLCCLCVKTNAQTFTQLHPGVEHAQVEHKLGNDPVKINLLRLDLKKVRLDVHHALDKAIGLETTSSIATRKGAVAAINAGFFRLDKSEFAGTAASLLAVDGHLLSETKNGRIGIGIVNSGKRTTVEFIHFNGFAIAGFGVDSEISFDGINQERKDDEIVIFTPEMGESTKTSPSGIEIVLTECKKREMASWCERAAIYRDSGNAVIPRDGLVISVGNNAMQKSNGILNFAERTNKRPLEFDSIMRVVFNIAASKPAGSAAMKPVEDLTNGVPQLIKNGKIDITWEQEKASKAFAETRHPRTAVAKLKDGKFLMMTVDGRQPGVSVGMSLQELAEYLFSLGAVDAMNLDGGGSTTMFLDGKVVNTPSDKEGERKVGDAIVVTLRNKKK
jgi:exopolysaccharide biosynthesis protein